MTSGDLGRPVWYDRFVITPALEERLREIGGGERVRVIFDLNPAFSSAQGSPADRNGRAGAGLRLDELLEEARAAFSDRSATGRVERFWTSKDLGRSYAVAAVVPETLRWIVDRDIELAARHNSGDWSKRAIQKVWPDFALNPLLDRSVSVIKGDAALATFGAGGQDITWAVVDSGIDETHPHFALWNNLETPAQIERGKDFTGGNTPYVDDYSLGHGTAVAGVIAGELTPEIAELAATGRLPHTGGVGRAAAEPGAGLGYPAVGHRGAWASASSHGTAGYGTTGYGTTGYGTTGAYEIGGDYGKDGRRGPTAGAAQPTRRPLRIRRVLLDGDNDVDPQSASVTKISGVAPQCRLVSYKVFDARHPAYVSSVIAALEQVQRVNDFGRNIRIHGVNISLGYPYNPNWFVGGYSPLCNEVDRLVQSGVVVVVAAGNDGFLQRGFGPDHRSLDFSPGVTINDPGNAVGAITVGSTHRDSPHTFGVSHFSSKGPTGDGRIKPDLVAPGEKIITCASAQGKPLDGSEWDHPAYAEFGGTSMAAAHVSGAIAAFLSVRREFIGRPERVKQIFMSAATDLGRVREFQGSGLVDVMRAIQSV
jgi:subtilisin family serine protease